MATVASILLDGVAYGMILFLISVGLSVTLGLMRVINLAHGGFALLGGAATHWLTAAGMSFWFAAPLAIVRCSTSAWRTSMATRVGSATAAEKAAR